MERVNRRELEQLKQYETKQAIKTKRVVRNKGHSMRTKGPIHQECITIIYTLNNEATKYIKRKLTN